MHVDMFTGQCASPTLLILMHMFSDITVTR